MAREAGREFFVLRTVAEAIEGFRPQRRTPAEVVELADAAGRVPVDPVSAAHDLPGFARATVDGYAVRAADTQGASEGMPSYLEIGGSVQMGRQPEVELTPGRATPIPTGAPIPAGADAVVMVEHTQRTTGELIEVMRPAAPGAGMVRADEDARAGAELAPAARPLRPQDLGLLAAAGVTEVAVHRRPAVAILATGDEVVAPSAEHLELGQVRDASTVALAALVREAGGESRPGGIVPDDRDALEASLAAALADADLVVISAGSSVGARDETAAAVAAAGDPGIWCHGLALRPGKPTLLAECGGVPIIGLPGNPRSALVVFRLVGMPIVRLVGGWTAPPPEPVARARLERDVPSVAGRLDVVQATLRDGVATPLFGASALLSVLTRADGYLLVPSEATGLAAGGEVDVRLY